MSIGCSSFSKNCSISIVSIITFTIVGPSAVICHAAFFESSGQCCSRRRERRSSAWHSDWIVPSCSIRARIISTLSRGPSLCIHHLIEVIRRQSRSADGSGVTMATSGSPWRKLRNMSIVSCGRLISWSEFAQSKRACILFNTLFDFQIKEGTYP